MYDGNGDNDGTEAERVKKCAKACHTQRGPLSGSWSGFISLGFTVIPSSGRCYCESEPSSCCARVSNDYDRYDWRQAPASGSALGSASGSGPAAGSAVGSPARPASASASASGSGPAGSASGSGFAVD